MRLKELSLHGYKSFAAKQRFVFPAGITAIVGPNGSGKSNIADAIRWALGEQRQTHLRTKRQEDLIFAGSDRRSRVGLAEVGLTFDNTDRWLEIDFAELVVGRRVHRDGSSGFGVNGSPIRLRDLLDLLGSRLGQSTYTVIGQGLVDSALALRPEDRRLLIDEAAGIVPLQRRRDRVLRQLAETDDNLTRTRDLLEDLGPRLKRMARLAERAAQYQTVSDELQGQLATWYGFQWGRARDQFASAQADWVTRQGAAAEIAADVARKEADVQAAQAQADAAEAALLGQRAEQTALTAAAAAARQAAAVTKARLEALGTRQLELTSTETSHASQLEGLVHRIERFQAEVDQLARDHALQQAVLAEATKSLAAAESRFEAATAAVEAARQSLFNGQAESGRLQDRRAAVAQAQVKRRQDLATIETAGAERTHLIETLEAELSDAQAAFDAADAAQAEIVSQVGKIEAELTALSAELAAARDAHAEARVALEALRARVDTLDALFGEHDEARPRLELLKAGGDVPVRGTVAQLLDVTPGWDAAVAAVLGNRVHGIVVEDRRAIDAALKLLLPTLRGQVTLVPVNADANHSELDDAGPHSARQQDGERDREPVVRAPAVPGLIETLFAGTAFVADLESAASAMADGAFAQAATQDGFLVARSGILTAGTPAQAVLELERERRALPADLEAAAEAVAGLAGDVDRLAAARRVLEGRLGDLAETRVGAARTRSAAVSRLEVAQARLDRGMRERDWADENAGRMSQELLALAEEIASLDRAVAALAPQTVKQEETLVGAQAVRDAIDLAAPREAVFAAAAVAAEIAQRLAGRRAMAEAAQRDLEAAEARRSAERVKGERTAVEIEQLDAEMAAATRSAEDHLGRLTVLEAALATSEADLQALRLGLRDRHAALEEARRHLRGDELKSGEMQLAASRAEGRLERLYDQLKADAEWLPAAGELAATLDLTDPAALNLPLPQVTELSEDVERRIAALRRDMRTIGAIDREALASYEESVAHFELLGAQRADLEAAERDLRKLLETLETEMESQFEATFAKVAEQFAVFFPQLFGGGEAQLVAARNDDGEVGIDILARPPDKRRQPLSLLSGGERALTAVALIFALVRVSQTPFVVLDEVDAALDEANVGRFCAALKSLAEETQVVIITHNRGTVQIASTVYGISMGEDGASQVISLRVEDMAAA